MFGVSIFFLFDQHCPVANTHTVASHKVLPKHMGLTNRETSTAGLDPRGLFLLHQGLRHRRQSVRSIGASWLEEIECALRGEQRGIYACHVIYFSLFHLHHASFTQKCFLICWINSIRCWIIPNTTNSIFHWFSLLKPRRLLYFSTSRPIDLMIYPIRNNLDYKATELLYMVILYKRMVWSIPIGHTMWSYHAISSGPNTKWWTFTFFWF